MSKNLIEVNAQVLEELEAWFASHALPKELQLDSAVYIPNLEETVKRLMEQAKRCVDNPKMHGCIYLLVRIKNMLEGHPEVDE